MVQTYAIQQPFYRQAPLTVDTAHAQQKYFEDEDGSILDDGILDHSSAIDSGLEMSPPMVDSRRESFAIGASLFSPKQEDWQSVEMQAVPSNHSYMDQQSSHAYMQHPQPQSYGAQGGQWSMSTSGSATPLQQFDGLPAEYDANTSIFQRQSMHGQTPFSNPTNQVTLFPGVSNNQSMASPPKDHWISQNQAMSKKMRPTSPSVRSHNELRRGDGIRKKNARFDIPAERNLNNIDQLISQSTDDQEIKELKQQKRLLRNRQAALDSRQRKKLHTERLEDEKKHYTAALGDMEEDMERLRLQVSELMQQKQECVEFIDKLNFEKEDMIRSHTIETGELRKKIGVLTSHIQEMERVGMGQPTAMHSHAGFHGSFGDMDGMGMENNWENMGFLNDFPMEPQAPEVKQELQVVPIKKNDAHEIEKPNSQGGLLFMLFLVGAFVLSTRQTASIPRVSEDVRAASATLLENVLKDAGVAQSGSGLESMAPQPSGAPWAQAPAPTMPMTGLDSVTPSMLGELSDSLTQPTQEQSNEQLFSLTAAQYNGVNSQDFLQNAPAERSTSQGRRNLAEALASMRSNSKAEVYTRSLLWDQIPGDVVRTFAKMVAECNPQNGGDGSNADG